MGLHKPNPNQLSKYSRPYPPRDFPDSEFSNPFFVRVEVNLDMYLILGSFNPVGVDPL